MSGGSKPGEARTIKHGMHIDQVHNYSPVQRSRLSELRELVQDEPGRLEIRRELAARMALVCDLGFAALSQAQKDGQDIWATNVMVRLQGFVAETRRLLDSFPDDGNLRANAELSRIKKVIDDHEQHANGDRDRPSPSPGE